MRKLRHAKIRNTGLLFEFLIRQTTADILDNSKKNQAVRIIKERFSSNTELGKELSLYNWKPHASATSVELIITEELPVAPVYLKAIVTVISKDS